MYIPYPDLKVTSKVSDLANEGLPAFEAGSSNLHSYEEAGDPGNFDRIWASPESTSQSQSLLLRAEMEQSKS